MNHAFVILDNPAKDTIASPAGTGMVGGGAKGVTSNGSVHVFLRRLEQAHMSQLQNFMNGGCRDRAASIICNDGIALAGARLLPSGKLELAH